MARTNNSQDRTGRQARPAQQNEPPLPWHSAPQQNPGPQHPQEPQFAPNYDVPPTQRPQAGHQQSQLPWPQAAPQNGYPQQQPAPSFPPQVQQPYPQAPYQSNGYPQPAPYPNDGHYYAQQQDPQGYPPPHYPDPQAGHQGYPQHADPAYPQVSPYPAQPYGNAPAVDPRGYDLGAYQTPAGYGDVPTTRPATPHNPQGYALEPPQHAQHYGHPPQQELAPHDEEEYDEDDYEDEDVEPPKRFRFMKIAASLLVATSIGAAGAYAYKKFGLSPITGSKQTLAKADVPPIKIQSASADGTKTGERLGAQIPAVVPANDGAADSDAPSGPRRVQTIPITPNSAPAQQQAQPPMRPTISVPGVALDGMATQPPPSAALPPVTPAPVGRAVAPPPVVSAQPQRAPVAPRVIAAADDQAAAAKAAAQTPAQQKVAVAKSPPKSKSNDAFTPNVTVAAATTQPAAAPSAVGAPTAAKSGANGYIAVLASQGSAVDARNTLDDLQTRFGQILGGKPTDITEFANPKDGKTYYRAIVGPPGSREAAANICAQMKAAGYKDCFATAY